MSAIPATYEAAEGGREGERGMLREILTQRERD
jgi:hypothetical protein